MLRSPGPETISVLVADDDPIFRSIVASRLLRLRANTLEAADSTTAWHLAATAALDVAVIDLGMPSLEGFALIESMRGHPRTRHIPIVVITAQDGCNDIAQALSVGATSFLTKPVNWPTFEHHFGYLLRLAELDRKSRTAQCFTTMLARSREAILSNLCKLVAEDAAEVRTSLRGLVGPLGAVPKLAARSEDLRRACAKLAGLEALAQKALDLSELLGSEVAACDRRIALSAILGAVADAMTPEGGERAITLRVGPDHPGLTVACDAAAVEMALSQLVSNAINHSPDHAVIDIAAHVFPDGLLAIEVTDHGSGMHPEFAACIMNPLFADTLGGEPGIGVGVVLAKAVAEAHGGTLEIQSMPQQGTTARFVIPPDRVTVCADVAA